MLGGCCKWGVGQLGRKWRFGCFVYLLGSCAVELLDAMVRRVCCAEMVDRKLLGVQRVCCSAELVGTRVQGVRCAGSVDTTVRRVRCAGSVDTTVWRVHCAGLVDTNLLRVQKVRCAELVGTRARMRCVDSECSLHRADQMSDVTGCE